MRRFSNSWPKTELARNFRFFAEVMVEVVDPSSWESLRCDSLSFDARLKELISAIIRVQHKEIPKPSLTPLIEEFARSLEQDPIAREILAEGGLARDNFDLSISSPTEVILRRANLLRTLIKRKYIEKCESRIAQFCRGDGAKKDTLVEITKCYAAELLASGNSRRHVFLQAREHFFSAPIGRCTDRFLARFFQRFKSGPKKYRGYFSCSKEFAAFMGENFGMEVIERVDQIDVTDVRSRLKTVFSSKLVAKVETSHVDPFSFADLIDRIIRLASVFFSMRPNHNPTRVGSAIYVVGDNGKVHYVQRSMYREFALPIAGQARRLDNTVNFAKYVFDRDNVETKVSFYSSVQTLAISLGSSDPEARLVALWAAFEVLLPQPTKDKESVVRITHFTDLLVPCILHERFKVMFEVTYRNLREQFGDDFAKFVGDHGVGRTKAEKFAWLILGENGRQAALIDIISESALAVYRVGRLNRSFLEVKSVIDRVSALEKKVEWQLHRIYRERNNIVHSGTSTRALDDLLEHGYLYYQSILVLIERSARILGIMDSDDAIEFINIAYRKRKARLQGAFAVNDKNRLDVSKFLDVVFDEKL